jgi:hypothetical protein
MRFQKVEGVCTFENSDDEIASAISREQTLARDYSLATTPMRIRAAVGFGIFIVLLRFMLPDVLFEGERTAILFLRGAGQSASTATSLIERSASTSPAATGYPHFSLPQSPYPTPF